MSVPPGAEANGPPDPNVRVRGVVGELVPDQEVDKKADDRLGHGQIAQQLADLTASIPVRSNVALYGAWGSGKSGIGNLLRAELEKKPKVGFARFDAFKYAEDPLRRNFISAVATELGFHDKDYPQFHSDLYSGTSTTTFDVPGTAVRKLAVVFVGLLLTIAVVLLGIAALAAAVQPGPFWEDFRPLVKQAVVASFTPAALLSALIVLAGRALGVDRKTDKAESSEQFEHRFKDLVKAAKKERLVIFVDELDRCAPGDVVATLDAVRTFLGNAGCVFVVAADRQAIEEALDKKLAQATPADAVNPYYSSGSAYLDKVFQYQMNVPPLLPASITRYAVDLVRPLPGVWTELGDRLDLTVSILVPSHARSPRRVKNLLNAFVLTYRLVEARQASGRLHGTVTERADEIARLVCLRIEFPLFARDLTLDARLPEYVLRLSEGEPEADVWDAGNLATDHVKALARGYAWGDLPVATLLSDDQETEDAPKPAATATPEDDQAAADRLQDADKKNVSRQYGKQLLDYLSRTRSVDGPRRDLLFMESVGSVVGLDGAVAERLEEAASNGTFMQVLTDIRALDEEGRQAALALLLGQARYAVGLERKNIALTLLSVAARDDIDVLPRADELADALAPALSEDPGLVGRAKLEGAWRLGLASERQTAIKLRTLVLQAVAESDNFGLVSLVLAQADAALDADVDATSKILSDWLLSAEDQEAAKTAELVLGLAPATAARLLQASEHVLVEELKALLVEPPAKSAPTPVNPYPPGTGQATRHAAQMSAEADTSDDADEPVPDPEPALAALRSLMSGDPQVAQRAASLLLRADHERTRTTAGQHLDALGTVADPGLTALILDATQRRAMSEWPGWLSVLDPNAIKPPALRDALNALVRTLWARATDAGVAATQAEVTRASEAVVALVQVLPENDRPSLAAAAREGLAEAALDDELAESRLRVLTAAQPLVATGALAPGVLAAREAEAIPETLHLDLAAQGEDSPMVRYVRTSVPEIVSGWAQAGVPGEPPPAEAMQALVTALYACTWLPQPDATRLPLVARGALGAGNEREDLPPLPGAAELDRLRRDCGHTVDAAIACWLPLAQPEPDDVLTAVATALQDRPSPALLAALAARASAYTPKDRLALVSGLISGETLPAPSRDLLVAVGIDGVPDIDVARLLSDRYRRSTNGVHRRKLMETWEAAAPSSEAARRHLFETVLIPLLKPKEQGGSKDAQDLAREYLPKLARNQPAGTKNPLKDAVVAAYGKDTAAKVLEPLGYKIKSSFFRGSSIE